MKLKAGFGKRLISARLKTPGKLTKADVAKQLGISKSAMGNYERRETAENAAVEHVADLANFYNVSIEWLLYGTMQSTIDHDALAFSIKRADELGAQRLSAENRARLLEYVYQLTAVGKKIDEDYLVAFYRTLK